VRSLLAPFLGFFLTPLGLIVLGALDSSLVFFLPLGIDFVVILASARRPELFWLYALAATIGSLIGAAGTYWIGHKAGEAGLKRWISPARLRRVQKRVSESAAPAIAALAVIPPPFPFTAFVLVSGALALDRFRFFATLAAVRALRFTVESALAARYGRRLLVWMDSPAFEVIVGVFIALVAIGTAISGVAFYRSTRRAERSAA
jgi:membrane protein YqaA with SNARE-associated domain